MEVRSVGVRDMASRVSVMLLRVGRMVVGVGT